MRQALGLREVKANDFTANKSSEKGVVVRISGVNSTGPASVYLYTTIEELHNISQKIEFIARGFEDDIKEEISEGLVGKERE